VRVKGRVYVSVRVSFFQRFLARKKMPGTWGKVPGATDRD